MVLHLSISIVRCHSSSAQGRRHRPTSLSGPYTRSTSRQGQTWDAPLHVYFSQHSAGAWPWTCCSSSTSMSATGHCCPCQYTGTHSTQRLHWCLVVQGNTKLGGIGMTTSKGSRLDTGGAWWCEVVSTKYISGGTMVEPAWVLFDREINCMAKHLLRSAREWLWLLRSSARGRWGQARMKGSQR